MLESRKKEIPKYEDGWRSPEELQAELGLKEAQVRMLVQQWKSAGRVAVYRAYIPHPVTRYRVIPGTPARV